MDLVTVIVLTILLIGGVWGSIVIAALLSRRSASLESGPGNRLIDALREDHRLLEARFEQLEEEVVFLRELKKPESPAGLAPGDHGRSDA